MHKIKYFTLLPENLTHLKIYNISTSPKNHMPSYMLYVPGPEGVYPKMVRTLGALEKYYVI